jgi:PPK2 family polyphosphate:nucleotide phosphotransferase
MLMERYRVQPQMPVDLASWDPDDKGDFASKAEAKEQTATLRKQLEDLQELLYAEHKHKLLIILQAMDTGGKDGVIRHVFDGVNPQGVKVAAFKVPTAEELSHDFLWRVHKCTPGRGEIVIFNRSHYEDVLVVRVHELAPKAIWSRRYEHINAFERMLVDEGATILKFFLYISKDEQKRRLQQRLLNPKKRWKFARRDVEERTYWDQYMQAYEDALSKTSTPWAPWYVVPANRKWYRNWVISKSIVATLEGLKMAYPQPEEELDEIVIE